MNPKVVLRTEAKARLARVSADQRIRLGAAIATRLWSLPEFASATNLLLYAALPTEVPTNAIATEARRRGIRVAYPRCLPDGAGMTLHGVDSDDRLVMGPRFRVPEPDAECPVVAVAEIDVAVIPGLGWDRTGHRLGRGAGHYDRILSRPDWRALRCGAFFSIQEFPRIPVDPWDARLDRVITEDEIVRF